MRIAAKHKVQKMIIFSTKAWNSFPAIRERNVMRLDSDLPPNLNWGTYETNGHVFAAYGLRHTQGAKGDVMRRAVRRIVDVPPPS